MITIPKTIKSGVVIAVSKDGKSYQQMPLVGFITIDGIDYVKAVDGNDVIDNFNFASYIGDIFPVALKPVISKSQLLGLLTQLDNLINNGADTAKALRSVADLYSKPEEVKDELAAIREIVIRAY